MSEDEAENSVNNGRKTDTSNELFKCGTWTFPWLMSVSLFRLTVYMNKLYQDSSAVSSYYGRGELSYCIISIFCLLTPPLVYMLYLILSYVKRENTIRKSEMGTKIIDGLLLIPWQIKSIVEVLHFSVQRVCQRRAPSKDEKIEHSLLDRKAMVLEFFEDFFAGFIQLVLQIYIILTYYDYLMRSGNTTKKIGPLEPKSETVYGEIVGSGLTLFSMLMAVRQKDDGLLSTFLSVFGWASIMGSRAFTIALAASVIHAGIIGFCFLHAILITVWLTPVCWRTYSQTQLSKQKKYATTFLVFFLFGLPSLIYWPILFHLKANKRPIIYMLIIIIENIGLFCIWYFLRENVYWDRTSTISVAVTAGGTLVGCTLISLYICAKPEYTDQIVLHDMKIDDTDSFGMYYDLCEITFQLHISAFVETNLQRVRNIK